MAAGRAREWIGMLEGQVVFPRYEISGLYSLMNLDSVDTGRLWEVTITHSNTSICQEGQQQVYMSVNDKHLHCQ